MTNYTSRPIEPFAVPARVLRNGAEENPNPPASSDTPGAPPKHPSADHGAPRFPEGVNGMLLDLLVGAALLALYLAGQSEVMAAAASSMVLLAVLLWRMSARNRRVAGPMLTISTLMLVAAIARFAVVAHDPRDLLTARPEDLTVATILGAVLYYTRVRCWTVQILGVISAIVLASGLLPGAGWVAVFAGMRYFLFVAAGAGLFVDFLTAAARSEAAATS